MIEKINVFKGKVGTMLLAARSRGFIHIIFSSSLVKIVSFISAMFLPRFLTKADYGLLVYVDNIRNYILLINGLGVANATLRYCAKDVDDGRRKGYFLSTIFIGIVFDILLIIATIFAYIFIPFTFEGSKNLLLLTSLLPIFAFLFEDIQLLLRATFENKKYSYLSFIYSFLMVILQILFAIAWGLRGVVGARYISVALCLVIGFFMIQDIKFIKSKAIFPDREELKGILKFSIVMLAANATSLVMQLNETFIIGQVLKDQNALADYKVASYILQVSLFFVQSLVIFIFPYFVRNMNDKVWVWQKFKKVAFYNGLLMIPMHAILILISKPFILIVFGAKYVNAIPIMQMLLIASLGQCLFRGIAGNILAGIGEEKFNLKINIIFTILHALIDVWAINTFGIYGAAIALTIVYYASGIIMILRLRKVCNKAVKG